MSTPGGKRLTVMRLAGLTVPLGVMIDIPRQRLIGMTTLCRTGIRGAEFNTQIRTRNPQTVVGSIVGAHVDTTGHVALDAEMAFAWLAVVHLFMKVMRLIVVGFRPMALGTEVVLFLVTLKAVNIMAVATAYTVLVHFALHEGTVDIDFIEYLAVRVVEAFA